VSPSLRESQAANWGLIQGSAVGLPLPIDSVDPDLADPAPGSPLRRTRPSRHQTVKAKAHYENHPANPESGLSDRSTESSTQRSTSALIFDSVAQERQPGRAIGVLSRPVVMSENPANHVFVDWDVERQGDLWAIRGQPQLGLRCFISTTA